MGLNLVLGIMLSLCLQTEVFGLTRGCSSVTVTGKQGGGKYQVRREEIESKPKASSVP